MRPLMFLALLALATLCLAGWADAKPRDEESGKGAAFVSKQEGSEVVKRLRRYLDHGLGAPAPYPDPLEPRREVCELNPACDELADHIGFQEAYRRLYAQPRALSPDGLAGSPQLCLLSGTPPPPLSLTSLPGKCEIPAAGNIIPAAPE
ncbi:LOW QUALITY PROTEIN: osteocalcin [Monodon monoceros]|uniref:LOW QUALITY PROTEIN: osteocalcin n=1 Tax=Monodon monoceros TaxID=40151 RepID=UPI0010F4B778|nr:LOW QUALITY PROTEIN: osteocalcin [Monodon monoceros]